MRRCSGPYLDANVLLPVQQVRLARALYPVVHVHLVAESPLQLHHRRLRTFRPRQPRCGTAAVERSVGCSVAWSRVSGYCAWPVWAARTTPTRASSPRNNVCPWLCRRHPPPLNAAGGGAGGPHNTPASACALSPPSTAARAEVQRVSLRARRTALQISIPTSMHGGSNTSGIPYLRLPLVGSRSRRGHLRVCRSEPALPGNLSLTTSPWADATPN